MALLNFPEFETQPAIVILLTLIVFISFAFVWRRLRARAAEDLEPYGKRDFISVQDLLDPEIRGDHLAFNSHLHRRFGGQRFVPVKGEDRCYVAFTNALCKDVMNDATSFSSNPFPDGRLVALNTMSKKDHDRVLRFVHSHYTQAGVENLEDRIKHVIARCTDELQSGTGGDVMTWAKRIHMASTLARLGICIDTVAWHDVDELIMLNDAMVALVAPLGGVGRQYESLGMVQLLSLLWGLLRSVLPTLVMIWRLGPKCAWAIVRPDVTLLCPPRSPRAGLWWYPDLLPLVPHYFCTLHRLLYEHSTSESPLNGIREGIAKGRAKDGLLLEEALTLLVQLMVNMTSANALGNLVFRLATEKDLMDQVSSHPELQAACVREVLRLDAPLQRNPRCMINEKPKWADAGLKKGDQVLLFLGAANMDPAVFKNPEEFRLDRDENPAPLSFGSGMHYCLGSSLVKLEMRLALEILVKRFQTVNVQEYERLTKLDVGNWGFVSLRVQLTGSS